MMTWWWQAAWKLPPPHQPSKQATHNYVTPCAPVQHCRLAHQHHQPPRSISHNPTCGETCLQHHQCGVHSLWSIWSSTTSNPSSIHISRCLLFLNKKLCLVLSNLASRLSSSSSPPPPQCMLSWLLLPRYWATSPVQPSPVQAQSLSTVSRTCPLFPTSQDLVPSWDLLLAMGNSTHHRRSIDSI